MDPYATNSPKPDAVTPLSKAWDIMVHRLFRPFEFSKWAAMALVAFLINCNDGMSSQSFNFRMPSGGVGPTGQPAPWDEYFQAGIPFWVWAIVAVVVLVALAFAVLIMWLRSRADFVFIDMISKNNQLLEEPWKEYAREGNAVFLLRAAIFTIPTLLAFAAAGYFLYVFYTVRTFSDFISPLSIAIIVGLVLISLPLPFIQFFISHFVVNIMYSRRCKLGQAAREGWAIVTGFFGTVLLFLLLRICLRLAMGAIAFVVACLSMVICVGCIPVVGAYLVTLVMLPSWVYIYGNSMSFIEQFGYPIILVEPGALPPMGPGYGGGYYMPMPPAMPDNMPQYGPNEGNQ